MPDDTATDGVKNQSGNEPVKTQDSSTDVKQPVSTDTIKPSTDVKPTEPVQEPTKPIVEMANISGYPVPQAEFDLRIYNAKKEGERKALDTLTKDNKIKTKEDLESIDKYIELTQMLGKHIGGKEGGKTSLEFEAFLEDFATKKTDEVQRRYKV